MIRSLARQNKCMGGGLFSWWSWVWAVKCKNLLWRSQKKSLNNCRVGWRQGQVEPWAFRYIAGQQCSATFGQVCRICVRRDKERVLNMEQSIQWILEGRGFPTPLLMLCVSCNLAFRMEILCYSGRQTEPLAIGLNSRGNTSVRNYDTLEEKHSSKCKLLLLLVTLTQRTFIETRIAEKLFRFNFKFKTGWTIKSQWRRYESWTPGYELMILQFVIQNRHAHCVIFGRTLSAW